MKSQLVPDSLPVVRSLALQPNDQDFVGQRDRFGIPALGAQFFDLCLQFRHPFLVPAGEHALPGRR